MTVTQPAWFIPALFSLALTSFATAQPAARPLPAATVAQIDSIVRDIMREKNLPSVAVGVWIPGQGEYQAAFGTANLQTGRMRQVGDAFRIASISKTFTATAILQLADQGQLSTSDLLSNWFPDFPNSSRITVKDLLTMRSGVAEYADADVLAAYYRRPLAPFTAQDAVRLAAAKVASFTAPDEQTVYTNTNYVLLEQIVERVSGQDMDAYLQANVMTPLGLRRTFYATGPLLPSLLHGYSLDPDTGTFRDMTWLNPQLAGGAGAVVSTLDDLHTYVRALCTGTLLQPATQAERLAGQPGAGSPSFIQYGEGVLLFGPFCGHNGSIFGFSSEAFYLPARDAVIVINVSRLDHDDKSHSSELFLRLSKALFPAEVNW
ncbi:serine hydrolase domain-containing protein [Deinococcus humi]|uniref:D-alanyl-D-alanine carboxypeptidase n=1 Tax=Deinococcus humi TaxID=662880 RepID=A0A7W8NGB3_9DEIO|nr:serine hydrolase domain-containing protein [Deinococcus humi]MBB5366344.1 D-alanyl-D-alanine carboxypeptidase [Deinococcus humi]GGO41355.1 beta-lactamase [Deinococcus humi]